MRAVLKELISPDIDIETYVPEEEDVFGFLLEATIGLDESVGGDDFQLFVCSPKWLIREHGQWFDLIWGRHMLIAFEYDMPRIRQKIVEYCNQCAGANWLEIVERLSRMFEWEYEDYDRYPAPS